MIYAHLRVSTDRQEKEGQGLDAQEGAARLLFSKDLKVAREVGSGRKESLEDRPILVKTLESLEPGDTIWFYDEDRMARDNGVKNQIIKIIRKKRATLQIRSETFDVFDIQDLLRLGLKGEFDSYMGAWLVQRMKAGRDIAVMRGRWYGGITTYGYKKIEGSPKDENYHKITPEPEEAAVYRKMVKWCLDGTGTTKIACRLNELGHKTNFALKGKKGRNFKWQQAVVLRLLRNPIYKGEFRYKDKVLKVPALISEKEWGRVQDQLKKNAINSTRNTKRFYLLRGLLYCDNCGRRFFGKIKESSGERLYCCLSKRPFPEPRSCGMRGLNLDKANHIVWSTVREYILNSKKLREAIKAQKDTTFVDRVGFDAELSTIRKKIAGKDSEVRDLLRARGRYKNIDEAEIDQLAGEIKSEKNDLKIREHELLQQLSKIDSIDDKSKEIERFLSTLVTRVDKLNENEKFEVLHVIIKAIQVRYNTSLKKHFLNICLALQESLPQPAFQASLTVEKIT